MEETDILTELANFKKVLQKLHEDLHYIRFLVATADATARKLHQGVELMLQDLEATAAYSPEAPVTPTCPSVPWKDYATDFEDDENTSAGNQRNVELETE